MTRDVGMDRNPRAIPARAAAYAGIGSGIVITLTAGIVLILALMSPEPVTFGQGVPVWPVAVGVAVAGMLLTACSITLRRRVERRDRNRAAAVRAGG